jgi:rod shape-determining protein MreC
VLLRLASPVVLVVRLIGDGITYSFEVIAHFPSLLREKNQLKTENEYLSRKVEELHNVESENIRLRGMLGLEAPDEFRAVNAAVIARPYDLWVESVIVGVGTREGVRVGNIAVNEKGLAGKVTEVHSGYSVIQLVSSPQCKIWAIAGDSRAEGMINGTGLASLRMDMIEAGSELMLGEKIFTRGRQAVRDGGKVEPDLLVDQPRGVFIGTVVSREADRNGFLKVSIEPAVSVSQLGNLAVLVK